RRHPERRHERPFRHAAPDPARLDPYRRPRQPAERRDPLRTRPRVPRSRTAAAPARVLLTARFCESAPSPLAGRGQGEGQLPDDRAQGEARRVPGLARDPLALTDWYSDSFVIARSEAMTDRGQSGDTPARTTSPPYPNPLPLGSLPFPSISDVIAHTSAS